MNDDSTSPPRRRLVRLAGMFFVSFVLCLATFALIAFVECKISG